MLSLKTPPKSAPFENRNPVTGDATLTGTPDSTTGPQALKMALEDACPSPLEKMMVEQLDALQLHPLRATVDGAPIMAEWHLTQIPCATQERILKEFLEHPPGEIRHWPTYPYASIPTFAAPGNVGSENRYTEMCRSLLATGLLPIHEVEDALTALALNSKDRIHDDQTFALCGLVSLGVAMTASFDSAWITGAAILYGAHLCNQFINRVDPRDEFFIGFVLENRDAFGTILTENLLELKSTLAGTFENPSLRSHYRRHLQVEGFLAARTLRLFGLDPVTISELFDASTRRDSPTNALHERLQEELKSQGHRFRASVTHTLAEEGVSPTTNSLSDFLDVLNRAYFTWAIHEKNIVREGFASTVLSAA